MRAVAVKAFRGAPEEMDLPKPVPGDGEILVHLSAAGVNPFDWKISDGLYEGKRPHVFPLILGVDGAGVVEARGPGATRFSVGDGVYGQFLHSPVGTGTYAEYVAAPEKIGIGLIPRGIYTAQAAAVPTAGMAALNALDSLALERGQSLLLIGAAGGVGSFVTQLASTRGIQLIAVTRGEHRDYLHKLGATRVLDSTGYDFFDRVKLAYSSGVDALLDLAQPRAAFEKNLVAVREGGTVASTVGAADVPALEKRAFRAINVDSQPSPELMEMLSSEISSGRLRVPVDTQLKLSDGPSAIAKSREGTSRGKTILNIY
ncbi:MAG: NADP-dependent oxidoreductase [Candidatus Lutacidiplasmatales archaeon]